MPAIPVEETKKGPTLKAHKKPAQQAAPKANVPAEKNTAASSTTKKPEEPPKIVKTDSKKNSPPSEEKKTV